MLIKLIIGGKKQAYLNSFLTAEIRTQTLHSNINLKKKQIKIIKQIIKLQLIN